MIETNWEDTSTVQRIIIYDSLIKTKNKISVGNKYGEIINFINKSIPSAPDGYLFLKDKVDTNIIYQMDTRQYPYLEYKIPEFKDIPGDLSIEYIIIS